VKSSLFNQIEENQKLKRTLIKVSISVSTFLVILKFIGYWYTGSTAILSDALETVLHVVSGAFALYSLFLSAKPPDYEHPYGHGNIEYFSAGAEGTLIIVAAIGIFIEGISMILNPHTLPHIDLGILLIVISGIANFLLGYSLLYVGNKTHSVAVKADGKHIMTDVYTSVSVIIGLILVYLTGFFWIDGVIACLIACFITFSGYKLLWQSASGLMQRRDPQLLEEVCSILKEHRKDHWIGIHQLRSKRSGSDVHVDFHLILPRETSLETSHSEVKEIEKLLKEHILEVNDVLIHVDPCLDLECSVCVTLDCDFRTVENKMDLGWDTNILTDSRNGRLNGISEGT